MFSFGVASILVKADRSFPYLSAQEQIIRIRVQHVLCVVCFPLLHFFRQVLPAVEVAAGAMRDLVEQCFPLSGSVQPGVDVDVIRAVVVSR